MNVPRSLCMINSVLWEKERNATARPPREMSLFEKKSFIGGATGSPSRCSGHIFLYYCIPTNDKWEMFDRWLCCLTATVWPEGRGRL